jgi:hypothetical protein
MRRLGLFCIDTTKYLDANVKSVYINVYEGNYK